MKIQIQIDTIDKTNKTIVIGSPIGLGALYDALETLLPNGKWREFVLVWSPSELQYINPIIVTVPALVPTATPYSPTPNFPWITYTCADAIWNEVSTSSEVTYALKAGKFSVEVNNE